MSIPGERVNQIEASTTPPPLLPHVNTRAFDCHSFQRVGNLNLAWVGWAIYPDLSSPSSGIHVFYLSIWSCLKVKSLLSQADGSEEKVYKKVLAADLAFYKQINHQIKHLSRVFEHNFGPEKREFEWASLKKFKCPGSFRGRGCWSFWIDRRLTDKKTIWTKARAKPQLASWYVYMMTPCSKLNIVSSFNAIYTIGLVFRYNLK